MRSIIWCGFAQRFTMTRICTFNVKGLCDDNKRKQVFEWLKIQKFTICLLQETHCEIITYDKWKREWGGDCFLSGNSRNSAGIGILISPNVSAEIIAHKNILDGRIQTLNIKINEKEILLINIYAPNDNQGNFFNTLNNLIIEQNHETMVIGGDFNIVLNPAKDKKNGNIDRNKRIIEQVNNMNSSNDLTDVWRVLNPDSLNYTWHSNNNPPIFCRLDYFLVSNNILNNITKCKITHGYKSDHSIVYFDINMENHTKGPGYFKLNSSILLENDYQTNIKNTVIETVEMNKDANPNTLWELIKGSIRNETIKYTSFKKKKENEEEKKLQKEIDDLEKHLTLDNNNNIKEQLKQKKLQLWEKIELKTKGIAIRAKAEWVKGIDKNTKYFANLEKKRQEAKTITRINLGDQDVTEPKQILKETEQFYKMLYQEKKVTDDDYFFEKENDTKLSNEDRDKCEGKITELECIQAIKDMKNNKSPGSDGIPVEFYKIFWKIIGKYLIDSLNYSFEVNNLTVLQKQGVITLLPKKDKDTAKLANWRPISLLNVDYKIATKVIANRMKKVLIELISSNQTGFLKGRYIGENVRTIMEVIEHANEQDIPGMIFFADFEKAFDSLNHSYIFKCLNYYNFGPMFSKWVKLFYNDAHSCVTNNGYMSEFFKIERGVRQGCPLSPYLFILALEPLFHKITITTEIQGMHMRNKHLKYTAFADDGTFFLNGSQKSLESLVNTLDYYSLISGLKLNANKSVILKIGALKSSQQIYCESKKFIWTTDKASTLGIVFTNNKQRNRDLNYIPKFDEFCNCLTNWKKHKLSLSGKITAIKSFALPKLTYPLTVLERPDSEMVKNIKKKMFEFLWDGKPEKISRNTIIQSYEDGGLRMVDIDVYINTIKCSWVRRLCDTQNNGVWRHVYITQIKQFGGTDIFKGNIKDTDVESLKLNSTFLSEILHSWAKVNFRENIQYVSTETIWNNSNLKHNKNTIYYKIWAEKNIKFISQLFNYRYKCFYTFDSFKRVFNLDQSDFLRYYTIIASIPSQWKRKLKTETEDAPRLNLLINDIVKQQYPNKIINKIQLDRIKKLTVIKPQQKWEETFNVSDWKYIYSANMKCTINTKFRNFQYKYIMRILPTNEFLLKCKIVSSSLCEFCNMYNETLKHLFWECQHIRSFWTHFQTFLKSKSIPEKLDFAIVSFGDINKKEKDITKTFLIILAKYYIFKCKYENTLPDISSFIIFTRHHESVERIIATDFGKLDRHIEKWNNLL